MEEEAPNKKAFKDFLIDNDLISEKEILAEMIRMSPGESYKKIFDEFLELE